jgi:hypothetical protein
VSPEFGKGINHEDHEDHQEHESSDLVAFVVSAVN